MCKRQPHLPGPPFPNESTWPPRRVLLSGRNATWRPWEQPSASGRGVGWLRGFRVPLLSCTDQRTYPILETAAEGCLTAPTPFSSERCQSPQSSQPLFPLIVTEVLGAKGTEVLSSWEAAAEDDLPLCKASAWALGSGPGRPGPRMPPPALSPP